MRGIGARALGSSQVSDWFARGAVAVPSRPPTLSPPRVMNTQYIYDGASSSLVTPSYAGAQSGDILIAVAYGWGGATQREVFAPTSSGLTFVNHWTHPTNASSNGVKRVDWARLPDTTNRAVTWTASGAYTWAGSLIVLRDVNTSSAPFETEIQYSTPAASDSPSFTGMTTAYAQSMVIAAVAFDDDNAPSVGSSGWTSTMSQDVSSVMSLLTATFVATNPDAIASPTFSETVNGPDAAYGIVFGVRGIDL